MKLPTLHGIVDRRILINFTADPDVVSKLIPAPFKVKHYGGKAIVGICLIRLKHIKPKGFPDFVGVASENGAHRIAVEWEEAGELRSGVYIPRRDSSSVLNALVGGRIFPGKHHRAQFKVTEGNGRYQVAFTSDDNTSISIDATQTDTFPASSIFGSLNNVSDFFKKGDVGYSPNQRTFEGMQLKAYTWEVQPLNVLSVHSSFFADQTLFPQGSIQFDNALLMHNIEHEWRSLGNKACCAEL